MSETTIIASREARLVPFSWLYHGMMRRAALKVEAERQPEATHDYHHEVASVVVFAAFVTETAINEIAYWLEVHLTQPIQRAAGFQKFSIRDKWRTVADRCGASGFDEGARPWTDFDALVTLRNALAHADAYPDPPEDALRLLDARGCTQPAMDWFESTMTRRTARWASATASAMPHTLVQMLEPHVDLHNGGCSWAWGEQWLPTVEPRLP
jgi:hypothetical protein